MQITKPLATLSLLLMIAPMALTQAPTATQLAGKWRGTLKIDFSKLPEKQRPTAAQLKQIQSVVCTLDLKSNTKFEAKMSDGKQSQVVSGKWFVKGGFLVTIDESRDGKAIEKSKQKEDKLKILKWTKTDLHLQLPDSGPAPSSLQLKKI